MIINKINIKQTKGAIKHLKKKMHWPFLLILLVLKSRDKKYFLANQNIALKKNN